MVGITFVRWMFGEDGQNQTVFYQTSSEHIMTRKDTMEVSVRSLHEVRNFTMTRWRLVKNSDSASRFHKKQSPRM